MKRETITHDSSRCISDRRFVGWISGWAFFRCSHWYPNWLHHCQQPTTILISYPTPSNMTSKLRRIKHTENLIGWRSDLGETPPARLRGKISPHLQGTISPHMKGTISPHLKGTISPDLQGTINPNLQGWISPHLRGRISSNLRGWISSNLWGTISPNLRGWMSTDLRGNCSGLWGDCTDLVGDCTGYTGRAEDVPLADS
jgi:hypothetical protein